MWTSLLTLTSVYAVLAAVEVFLIVRYVRGGVEAVLPPESDPDDRQGSGDALAFAY